MNYLDFSVWKCGFAQSEAKWLRNVTIRHLEEHPDICQHEQGRCYNLETFAQSK